MHIAAAPEDLFGYLTDPARYIEWMSSQATLEPAPGGTYQVQMADGFAAAGTFTEVEPPHRLVFTWRWADDDAAQHVLGEPADTDNSALPPGSARVEVTLDGGDGGTRLALRHHGLTTGELRDAHQVAWETYLHRLAIRATGGDPGPDPHHLASRGLPVPSETTLPPSWASHAASSPAAQEGIICALRHGSQVNSRRDRNRR